MAEDIEKLRIALEKLKISIHYLDVLMANDVIQDNDIDKLQLQVAEFLLDVEVLGSRLDVKETENSEISVSLGNLEAGLTDLSTQYVNSLASITHNQETFVDDLEASASSVTEVRALLADETGRIDGQAILVNDLSTKVIRTAAGVTANALASTALSAEVDNVSASLVNTQEVVASNTLATSESITALESGIVGLNGFYAANSTALMELGTRTEDTEDGLVASAEGLTELSATVGDNTSNLAEEISVRAGETSAIAASLDLLNINVGALSASFIDEVELRADGDIVTASSITSLTTTSGINSATISTVTESVNGLSASYGVTIDVGGNISGFGLLAKSPNYTPPTVLLDSNGDPILDSEGNEIPEDPTIPAVGEGLSKFWVRADTFSIINPLNDSVHPPFEVKGGDVFIRDAYIEDASITNAKIGNYIESGNWDDIFKQGWHINKTGAAYFNELTVTDTAGNTILSSGTGISSDFATRNVFKGYWVTGTAYKVGDIVLGALGYGWSCMNAHTSSTVFTVPVYPIDYNSNWTLYAVKGVDAITTILGNETHTFSAGVDGTVGSYTGSGTTLRVFDGAREIIYDETGTDNGTWKVTTAATNITLGTLTDSGDHLTIGDHSAVAASTDVSSIIYTITGKRFDGSALSITTQQSFSKSKAGINGDSYTGTVEHYKLTNSTNAPTIESGSWLTSPQNPTSTNQYLWNYNANTRTIGADINSPVSLITQYVEDGRGISSIGEVYAKSNSDTIAPTTWDDTITATLPLSDTSPYLWNKTTITYSDATTTSTSTIIAIKGIDADALTVSTSTVAGVTTLTFSDGTTTTIDDGTSSGVKIIYATDASGTDASFTQGTRRYANYYEWTGNAPTDVPTPTPPLTYTLFIGEDGDHSGVLPVYADDAAGTNASFSKRSRNKDYVNFYEWTETAPITMSDIPANLTYVKFVGSTARGPGFDAVPAYSNADYSSVTYDESEAALVLQSDTDTATGMAYPAFNVEAGNVVKFSVTYKSSSAASTGLYVRVYEYDSDLPSGKLAISNSATNSVVQEDTRNGTISPTKENKAVTTSYQTQNFTYTPTSSAKWASVVILNWSGMGNNSLFVKAVKGDMIGSAGAQGPAVVVTSSRQTSFTSTDTALDSGQSAITFTATVSGVSSPTYVWSQVGCQTAPRVSTSNTYIVTAAQFGTAESVKIKCTVSGAYTDDVTIVRLDSSTAAANATVGATFGTNIGGQITSGTASTYIADAAIGSAQVGSIKLVGNSNFSVKSSVAGQRIEMDGDSIKVYDASGTVRVKMGNLNA